jgi:hypothetical protein
MDSDSLVINQIDDGKKLVNLLIEKGFDVLAAFWVRTTEDGQWTLYIASGEVDGKGVATAHRELYSVYRSIPDAWVLLSDVKLIGANDPMTKEVLEIQNRFPSRLATRSRRKLLGDLAIDEVYIYPISQAEKGGLRQSFGVHYYRQKNTDNWRAEIKRESLHRGMKAKGAVAYSTACREGHSKEDENFAIVSVLVEVDPRFDDPNVFIHPDIWEILANQACQMADEMFLQYQPNAVIEHIKSEE